MDTNRTEPLCVTLRQAERDFVLKEVGKGFIILGMARDSVCGSDYFAIKIPQLIDGKPVFRIGAGAFRYCDKTCMISIPEGIEEIGEGAFKSCTSLSQISLPSTLRKIGSEAFSYCSALSEIEIPKGVTELGVGLFSGCANLTSIVVDSENSFYDSRGGCNAIIETKSNILIAGCSATVIPGDIVALGESCFYDRAEPC